MPDDTTARFVAQLRGRRPGTHGWQQARCPFHDDRHASFSFHVDLDRWRCFAGCGAGRLSLAARYGPRR